ncbi:MAG: CoA transferase [Acidimicrobiales bacterium]|nr:CoA transferase [Acidimicrobiales bacterium]
MTGPLAGIRVIDTTAYASGPLATVMLADQGADVIKVEPPGTGDLMRTIGATRQGMSAIFATLNRNKRSIALDIQTSDGQAIAQRLAEGADVFVHNFRPSTPARLGLDEMTLRDRNQRLIYVAISGFGGAGPYRDRRAYDSVVQAMSGVAAHQADPGTGVPQFIRNAICDKTTGLVTSQLVTSALFAREREGTGQRVDVSMLHTALYVMWSDGMQNVAWLSPDADSAARATQPPVRRTSDGFLAISTNQDVEFRALCGVLDLDELADDPRFALAGDRSRNSTELWDLVEPVILTWSTEQLSRRLDEHDIPYSVVQPLDHIHEAEQIVANDLLAVVDQPPAGPFRTVRPVGQIDGAYGDIRRAAPLLGEHSAEVLREIGVDEAEYRRLVDTGVVGE